MTTIAKRAGIEARFLRHTEYSFGDDVALNFVRAAGDRSCRNGNQDLGDGAAHGTVCACEHGVGARYQGVHMSTGPCDVARGEFAERTLRALRPALSLVSAGSGRIQRSAKKCDRQERSAA